MQATIDTDRLKEAVDLRDLAGRYVTLRQESATEQSGPCPRCGGEDRFHVKAETFFCRQCYPLGNGQAHDAIAFLQWAGVVHDFKAACAILAGGAIPTTTTPRKATPVVKADPPLWDTPVWQADARREIEAAQAHLDVSAGELARGYLLARGLHPLTWRAWGLGYGSAWDRELKERRPAIVLPWRRDRVTAIKYRFLDSGGLRYTSKAGGQCIAFGLGLAGKHHQTLWLIEGELNAISLWQALTRAGCVNWDVVSFGAEHGATSPVIRSLAGNYRQVIVWADDPGQVASDMRAIPDAFGLRSPEYDGQKLDANALLQRGILAEFARAAWARFDQDPAYTARLWAELGA